MLKVELKNRRNILLQNGKKAMSFREVRLNKVMQTLEQKA